ncbi:MAG: CehA/McbA family metallohydrolase [Chloroflexi bacterium]|nr:CehA/McbA family metallohydrolase [Chloroflexota bacterium]
MSLYERVGNIHIHTLFSDGTASPTDVAAIAERVGLDYILITDHIAYPREFQGWHGHTLVLIGEEVHAPASPHLNHFLAFNAGEDVARYGDQPQRLIDAVRARGGLGFIAHPYERSGAFVSEPEINWVAWDADGYTGLEIWNYMSEFKAHVTTLPRALLYAFFPQLAITGPFPETLAKWDQLQHTRRIVGIGGSDAHATIYHLGPLARRVFSYQHLFRSVNTHLLVSSPWTGDASQDAQLVYQALAAGRAFVAYGGLAPARGFSFTAECDGATYTMGDEFSIHSEAIFRARVPARAHLRLIHNGACVAEATGTELIHRSSAPGFYRIEALRHYAFRERGWVYSNPIYVISAR